MYDTIFKIYCTTLVSFEFNFLQQLATCRTRIVIFIYYSEFNFAYANHCVNNKTEEIYIYILLRTYYFLGFVIN
jgi:hypothetical protein